MDYNIQNKIRQIEKYKPIKPTLKNKDFKSLSIDETTAKSFIKEFLKYIFINLCNCSSKECIIFTPIELKRLNDYIKSIQKPEESIKCNLIYNAQRVFNFSIPDAYQPKYIDRKLAQTRLKDLDYVLDMFVNMKLLIKSSGRFFLFNGQILSWESIKKISYKDIIDFYNKGDVPKLVMNMIYILFCDDYNKKVDLSNIISQESPSILNEQEELKQNIALVWRYLDLEPEEVSILDKYEYTKSNVPQQITIIIQCIFWYLRKFIIDSLLIITLGSIENDVSKDTAFGLSIGSTNLSSDYDITMYGETNTVANIIDTFNKTFAKIFGDPSHFVFDTNLYGISFIMLKYPLSENYIMISPDTQKIKNPLNIKFPEPDLLSDIISCNNKDFKYIKSNIPIDNAQNLSKYMDDTSHSQHVWAIVKLINIIRLINVDSVTFDTYIKYIDDQFNQIKFKIHYDKAKELTLKLEKLKYTYTVLLNLYKYLKSELYGRKKPKRSSINIPSSESLNRVSISIPSERRGSAVQTRRSSKPSRLSISSGGAPPSELYTIPEEDTTTEEDTDIAKKYYISLYNLHINYISLINYHGDETYFTRGAFLDIVVNSQMCNKTQTQIPLLYSDYMDSFIENLAELILHQKIKYIERAYKALKQIPSVYTYIQYDSINLDTIKKYIVECTNNNVDCIDNLRKSCIYIIVKAFSFYMKELCDLQFESSKQKYNQSYNESICNDKIKEDLEIIDRIIGLKEKLQDIDRLKELPIK